MYKKSIFNNNLPNWYMDYGKRLTEQANAPTAFSEDTNERIKQYLDANENLLSDIDAVYQTVPDGTVKETFIELDSNKYAVLSGDEFTMIIDKSDANAPRISISIENEKLLLAGVDLDAAAGYVYKSMDGMGTYEDMYAGALAAITKVLLDKGVSQRGQQRVFDIFNNKAFGTKFEGENLDDWIDGDFDGRAEACALALARRPIPKSMIRGVNWGTIFMDVGMLILAVPTLGASLAATSAGRAAISGGRAVTKLAKTVKNSRRVTKATNKAKAIGKAIKGGKIMARVTPTMTKAWKALGTAGRLAKAKAFMPVGKTVEWLSKAKNVSNVRVMKYFKNAAGKTMVKLQNVASGGKLAGGAFSASVDSLLLNAGKAGGMSMKTFTKFAAVAGLMLPVSKLETGNLEGVAGEDEEMDDMFNPYNPAELLGYYDQTTADPVKAMNQYKQLAAADLATQLHDAMDGWTDNSDELAIALMVMSMDKQVAIDTKTAYEKAYPGTNFYNDVIGNELESDMEQIVGNYWAAITGDGPHVANVNKYVGFIAK